MNFSVSLGFRLKEDLCTEIILDIVAALQLYFLWGKYFAYILNSTQSVSLIPIGLTSFANLYHSNASTSPALWHNP